MQARTVKREYRTIVWGQIWRNGRVDQPFGRDPKSRTKMAINRMGKPAVTRYEVLERFSVQTYLRCNLETGRTHQIRVHMKHLGNPIVCDDLYGDGKPVLLSQVKKKFKLSQSEDEERPILSRLALHSSQLSFKGMKGETIDLEAPLPKDLRATINQLSKQIKKHS